MGIEENKRIAVEHLKAMGEGRDSGLLAEGATWWLPRHGKVSFSYLAGIMERVAPLLATPIAMTIDHITAEGDRVALETTGYAETRDGAHYNNVYHFLFFIRDGKIHEIHEHGDSGYAHRVFGFNPTEDLETK